jgi:hypothetical protein
MAAQRQNPAYRPAKEKPRPGGAFLCKGRRVPKPPLHWAGLACGSDGASTLHRAAPEILIPGHNCGVIAERQRACEMDSVISAQCEILGKIARSSRECRVDPDEKQLALQ